MAPHPLGRAVNAFLLPLLAPLLGASVAHADVAIEPPTGKQFMRHHLSVENMSEHAGFAVVVFDAGDTISTYRAFTATSSAKQELGWGGQNRGPSLFQPTARLMSLDAFEAWKAATGAEVDKQREACADRGEGCAHISRFVPRFAPPADTVDCKTRFDLELSGEDGGPDTRIDVVKLTEATRLHLHAGATAHGLPARRRGLAGQGARGGRHLRHRGPRLRHCDDGPVLGDWTGPAAEPGLAPPLTALALSRPARAALPEASSAPPGPRPDPAPCGLGWAMARPGPGPPASASPAGASRVRLPRGRPR